MHSILLVDDDPDLVEANRIFLESQGYRISCAGSGQEGWETLLKEPPDLIVLDCMMEEFTTGFELAGDIKIKFPKLPMIMLTGVREFMSRDWRHGAEDEEWLPIHVFLEKPVTPQELQRQIEKLLSHPDR